MRFRLSHATRYRYARPVFLGPHVLRLRPRCDGTQHVGDFRVRVQPRPCGWSESIDLDGNAVAHVWFDGLTESLAIVSTVNVEPLRANPFDFLLEPSATRLPLCPSGELVAALAPYQVRHEPDESVTQFAAAVSREVEDETVPFLTTLSRRIAEHVEPQVRLEGDPQPPALTLRQATGACRDVAVLFVDACRALGLPARFVSGYYGGPVTTERRYLHAWAEVFLPGAGWRGFDPLQGVAVADQHIAVAASAYPSGAAPISGTLRGAAPLPTLQIDIELQVVDELVPAHHDPGTVKPER